MLFDYAGLFTQTAQAVTSTADGGTILDSGFANPNLGKNGAVGAMIVVTTSFANATSMSFDVYHGVSSADTLLVSSGAIAEATLVAGFRLFLPYPPLVRRYRKITFTVVGTHNAGAVFAGEGSYQG